MTCSRYISVIVCNILFLSSLAFAVSPANEINEKLLKLEKTFQKQNFENIPNILHLISEVMESEPNLGLQYVHLLRNADKSSPEILNYYELVGTFFRGNYQKVIGLSSDIFSSQVADAWLRKAHVYTIKSHYYLKDYQAAVNIYERLRTLYRYSNDHESLLKLVASSYYNLKDAKNYYAVLEGMASLYPYSYDAKNAFNKLLQAECSPVFNKKYVFSYALLKKLSWAGSEFSDLKDFILARLEGPIYHNRTISTLSNTEKISIYMKMRFYDEAILAINTSLKDQVSERDQQKLMQVLGQIFIRQGKPEQAIHAFNKLKTMYPTYRSSKTSQWLADSMRYANMYGPAAEIYGRIYRRTGDEYTAWNAFWSNYRSQNYSEALTLLESKSFRSRDGEKDATVLYWKSKILEKQGKTAEAQEQVATLLKDHGQSIYATLAVFKNPELKNDLLKSATIISSKLHSPSYFNTEIRLALSSNNISLNTENSIVYEEVPKLLEKELFNPVRSILKKAAGRKNHSKENIIKLQKLLQMANIYTPRMGWMRKLNLLSYRLPEGFASYHAHLQKNQELWQLYYPKAYEAALNSFSKSSFDTIMTYGIMRAESFYREDARSSVGAAGLMQIMPQTAYRISKELNDADFNSLRLVNPKKNLEYASFYIDKLLNYFDQNFFVALAAYNAGPHYVQNWLNSCDNCEVDEFIESIPFRETRRYVKKVTQNIQHYSYIYDKSWNFPTWPQVAQPSDKTTWMY